MKQIAQLLSLMALMAMPSILWAQEMKDYSLVYLRYMSQPDDSYVNELCTKMLEESDGDLSNDIYGIYYVSNAEEPKIAKVDDPNFNDSFSDIINAFQEGDMHISYPSFDADNILKLLKGSNFVDENGNVKDGVTVQIAFYIDSKFWENEEDGGDNGARDLIKAMYYALDIPNHSNEFDLVLYRCGESELWEKDSATLLGDFVSNKMKDYLRIVNLNN